MRIFITGGNGFIGRHLVRRLEENHEITIFDDFSNSDTNIKNGLIGKNLNFIKGDIRVKEDIIKSSKDHDVIIHLAAKISIQDSIRNPDETFQVNVDGTKNVLEACLKNNIKNIIANSSAAVYGNRKNQNDILFENSKTEPMSPYGESKLIMEEIIQEYSIKNKINSIILRIFNVYGIGQSDEYSGVITKFLKNSKEGKILKIFGNGMQTRDFISINDITSMIENSLSKLEGKRGEIYNIATGKTTTIHNLAKMIIEISKSKSKIEFSKPLDGDIIFSRPSIEKAQTEINFYSKIKIINGLKQFIAEYEKLFLN